MIVYQRPGDRTGRCLCTQGLCRAGEDCSRGDGTLEFVLLPPDVAGLISASASEAYQDSPRVTVSCMTLRSASGTNHLSVPDAIKMESRARSMGLLHQTLEEGTFEGISQLIVEFHRYLLGLRASQTRLIIARLRTAGCRIGWVGRTSHEYLLLRHGNRYRCCAVRGEGTPHDSNPQLSASGWMCHPVDAGRPCWT